MSLNLERKYSHRFGSSDSQPRSFAFGVPSFIFESQRDDKLMVRAIAIATAAHLALFAITFPSFRKEPTVQAPARTAYVMQAVRFQPPEPKSAPSMPKRKVKKVPIPDPTPDLPEPLVTARYEAPQLETLDIGDFDPIIVPDAPPGPSVPGALPLGGEVNPPIKLFSPQPGYTEEARQARVQGVVILQAIIDIVGNVTNVKILKGLPGGLADSAVDTVLSWKFEPASLDGDPVPVYYNFTVNFTLQ